MKKIQQKKIADIYKMLASAKMSKMKDEDRFSFIRTMNKLRPIANGVNEIIADACKRLEPDGWDGIVQKISSNAKLSVSESETLNKYNRDVQTCVNAEINKEVEVDFEELSMEAISSLSASNDYTLEQTMLLNDVLGHEL